MTPTSPPAAITPARVPVPVLCRWLIRRDFPEVMDIEAGNLPPPWSEDDLFSTLLRRECIGMVAERGGAIVGYMVYALAGRRVVLLRLAVDPAWRRRGVGRQMVEKLKGKLRAGGRTELRADVPDSALAAHLWLRACGLRAESVEHGLDPAGGAGAGGDGDVYRFVHRLGREAPR